MAIESVLKEGSSVRIHMPSTAIHEIELIGKYHVILLASLPAFSSEMMIATPPLRFLDSRQLKTNGVDDDHIPCF